MDIWVKFSIKMQLQQNFSLWDLSIVRRAWNVYWTALIPRNLPFPKTFLIARLLTRGSRNEKGWRMSFLVLFWPTRAPHKFNHTTTSTKVEHHAASVNALPSFNSDLYYFFKGVRYAKNGQNYPMTPLFRCNR